MFHKTVAVGRLGRDPEMRYTKDGKPYTKFSVAAEDYYGGETHTTWYNVTVWGNQAEPCNTHLNKGALVLVEGNVNARPYQTSGGDLRASLDLNASVVKFLSTKVQEAQGSQEEEIPF